MERLHAEFPWRKIVTPPDTSESKAEWHARRLREQQDRALAYAESEGMCGEDKAPHSELHVSRVRSSKQPAGRHVRDLGHEFYTRADANADLQKTKPEWYGKFLKEGECYETPRTEENLQKAFKDMQLDQLPEKYHDIRPELEKLIYEHWVLFDGKLRAVHGAELDMDLSDCKPIRKQAYRFSPIKLEARYIEYERCKNLGGPST